METSPAKQAKTENVKSNSEETTAGGANDSHGSGYQTPNEDNPTLDAHQPDPNDTIIDPPDTDDEFGPDPKPQVKPGKSYYPMLSPSITQTHKKLELEKQRLTRTLLPTFPPGPSFRNFQRTDKSTPMGSDSSAFPPGSGASYQNPGNSDATISGMMATMDTSTTATPTLQNKHAMDLTKVNTAVWNVGGMMANKPPNLEAMKNRKGSKNRRSSRRPGYRRPPTSTTTTR